MLGTGFLQRVRNNRQAGGISSFDPVDQFQEFDSAHESFNFRQLGLSDADFCGQFLLVQSGCMARVDQAVDD
jgi:hypothetical protein